MLTNLPLQTALAKQHTQALLDEAHYRRQAKTAWQALLPLLPDWLGSRQLRTRRA